ncbi:glycosyltransferase involved in cell wall biosynthesis [Paenochrobactrum gallinarii]|uniref:Glycosyltransferase involved in cell wall biosynthesis n=1 Tax=Paenochrobactrum gallinarii TaxID=643673 RepID=A0A841MAT5_9HYPH|nr:glycosyltransferase family 4 protein [Paenochrobactrum gallinarii]MBB6262634.1 glycosyltransferase involved in cell wall biosynthesis [Paenochrobactrum gallinarii]
MIAENVKLLKKVIKRDGYRIAARKIFARLKAQAPVADAYKINTIKRYEFLLGEEQGFGLKLTSTNLPKDSMTWLIPDFEAHSGGHINIFRMIKLLRRRGFPYQHVVIMEPHRWASVADAQAAINQAFGDHGITVSLGVRSIEPCTFLFATGWQTAYWVSKYKDAIHKLYFVQDFEPDFYASGSEYYFAENTYKLGLTGITAGTWLASKLEREYGMKTFPYSFSCDTSLYKPTPRADSSSKKIFFYARPVTPRRCFEMGLLALKKVCEANPNATVVFAGWDVSGYDISFPHINHGTVAVHALPDLYSQCDVALILSSTNLSLLPLEVAACGCPVVLNDSPQSNWLLSKDQAIYCDMSVESISSAIIEALDNEQRTAGLANAAFDFVRGNSWDEEAAKVAVFLRSISE